MISFFSKKEPKIIDAEQPKTVSAKSRLSKYVFKSAQQLESVATRKQTTRPKTAGIHRPYVLTPSFVFGTGIEPVYDSFPLATWSPPNTSLRIAECALESGDVVLSFANETYEAYEPPSAPVVLHTFKPRNSAPVSTPDPDLIELDPNQPDQNVEL